MSLKDHLEEKYREFNRLEFIELDPISIPHQFKKKEDIEIAGFLTALIAWGNRKSIIKSAQKMMQLMDNSPHDFTMHHRPSDLKNISNSIHRTFNSQDFQALMVNIQHHYVSGNGLRGLFENDVENSLKNLRSNLFSIEVPKRSYKHIADISSGSAAKRINMFLRWMVRKDDSAVDFGIWEHIHAASLFLPLDVHSGKVARQLGLLRRKQNDWKAVEELTEELREFDPNDPAKYDFALFGISAIEKFT